jgi:glycosyltransferase involved in cell wall biosynthesis
MEAFNPIVKRDVVIGWRNHSLLDVDAIQARRFFLDLHDVQDPGAFTPARVARCAGYLFKSDFHARGISLPDEKRLLTRNAIDPALFAGDAAPRACRRIVYASSPDRGLLTALRVWSRLHDEFRDAEFHVYYGFTPLYLRRSATEEYQYFGDDRCERHMLDYAEECFDLMSRLPRVFNHGRVGWAAMADAYRTSGIWLYPTRFPEISCMSAMEAQAGGCWPVCAATGALPETVRRGTLLPPDGDLVGLSVAAIRERFALGEQPAERAEMSAAALRDFSVSTLAEEWLALFDRAPVPA